MNASDPPRLPRAHASDAARARRRSASAAVVAPAPAAATAQFPASPDDSAFGAAVGTPVRASALRVTGAAAAVPVAAPRKLLERGPQFGPTSIEHSAAERAAAARTVQDIRVAPGQKHIVVVGAGIAGLFAAKTLQDEAARRGIDAVVTVLEAGGHFGGRAKSDAIHLGSRRIITHHGAQMGSAGYDEVNAMVQRLGLAGRTQENSPYASILQDGAVRRFSRDDVMSTKGTVLSDGAWWRLGQQGLLDSTQLRGRSVRDPAQWLDVDTEDGRSFDRRYGTEAATLVHALIHAFYFQRPEDMSQAVGMSLMGAAVDGKAPLSIDDGFGALADALGDAVGTVVLNAPVQSLQVSADGIDVRVQGHTLRADEVVLATTADVARRLHPNPTDAEQRLLDIPYVPTFNVILDVERDWANDPRLAMTFGIEVPPSEMAADDLIASISLASGRTQTAPRGRETVQLMLDARAAARLIAEGASGDDILARAVDEAERKGLLPGLKSAKRSYECVVEVASGLPRTPPGRFSTVRRYEESLTSASRIKLAGDYRGFPRVGSAALAGVLAAQEALNTIEGRAATRLGPISPPRVQRAEVSSADRLRDGALGTASAAAGWADAMARGDLAGAADSYARGWQALLGGIGDAFGGRRRR